MTKSTIIERLHNNDFCLIAEIGVNYYDIAKKLSKGLLMGARGNSGVILSQIFRGFAMGLEGHESVDAVAFANAWKSGAEVAYKAVMRPVEGTILTVIREASEKIVEYTQPGMEIEDVFSYFVKEAENSLERTPELLPVLKEVGVVDSGGAGLLLVLTGFMAALTGDRVDFVDITDVNEEGLLYDEEGRKKIAEKFKKEKIDGLLLAHCNLSLIHI